VIVPFSVPSCRVGRNHVEKLCGFTRLSIRSNIFSQAVMPVKIPQIEASKAGSYFHRCGYPVDISPTASAPSQSRNYIDCARGAPGVTTLQTVVSQKSQQPTTRFARSAVQPVSGDSLRCRESPQAKILRRPDIHTQVFHRFSTHAQYAD
jgi:hypothetical protein